MSLAVENVNRDNWITPERQRELLQYRPERELRGLERKLLWKFALDLIDQDRDVSANFDPDMVTRVIFPKAPIRPELTYWYTALDKLGILPDLVPTLPENFYEIYFGNCPIKEMEGKQKKDETPYKLYETHSLYLIPPVSLDDLEARVSAYGREVLGAQNDDENPLRFRGFYLGDLFGPIESDRWEWVLIPNEVLEVSRGKTFSQQLETLETLNQRVTVGPNYGVGTLKQVAAFLFFHKVATGESFYERGDAQNGNRSSYVRVQEADEDGEHLIIGSFVRSGVVVDVYFDDWHSGSIGLAALRKFSP